MDAKWQRICCLTDTMKHTTFFTVLQFGCVRVMVTMVLSVKGNKLIVVTIIMMASTSIGKPSGTTPGYQITDDFSLVAF
jgi:hypothetical protein